MTQERSGLTCDYYYYYCYYYDNNYYFTHLPARLSAPSVRPSVPLSAHPSYASITYFVVKEEGEQFTLDANHLLQGQPFNGRRQAEAASLRNQLGKDDCAFIASWPSIGSAAAAAAATRVSVVHHRICRKGERARERERGRERVREQRSKSETVSGV